MKSYEELLLFPAGDLSVTKHELRKKCTETAGIKGNSGVKENPYFVMSGNKMYIQQQS